MIISRSYQFSKKISKKIHLCLWLKQGLV